MRKREAIQPTLGGLVLLEGIFAAIFGFLLLMAPGSTLVFLVQVLGFYLLIGGILRIVSIFLDSSIWGLKLVLGIIGIIGGIGSTLTISATHLDIMVLHGMGRAHISCHSSGRGVGLTRANNRAGGGAGR